MGVRRHAGCPFTKARGYRQAVSAATGSLNVNRGGNATKSRLTGADAFDLNASRRTQCHEMRSRAWCIVGRECAVKIILWPWGRARISIDRR